jgi:hypothetical protein
MVVFVTVKSNLAAARFSFKTRLDDDLCALVTALLTPTLGVLPWTLMAICFTHNTQSSAISSVNLAVAAQIAIQ